MNGIGFKKPYDRNQLTCVSPIVEDGYNSRASVPSLGEALESLDLSDFNKDYKPGTGRKAYPPEILLGTLLYAYSLGMSQVEN